MLLALEYETNFAMVIFNHHFQKHEEILLNILIIKS